MAHGPLLLKVSRTPKCRSAVSMNQIDGEIGHEASLGIASTRSAALNDQHFLGASCNSKNDTEEPGFQPDWGIQQPRIPGEASRTAVR